MELGQDKKTKITTLGRKTQPGWRWKGKGKWGELVATAMLQMKTTTMV